MVRLCTPLLALRKTPYPGRFPGIVDKRYLLPDQVYAEAAEYPAVVPPPYDRSLERLKYERKVLAEKIKNIPTAEEKIEMVSPYERMWTRADRRWHRPWMEPLYRPRYAWRIDLFPRFYGMNKTIRYITKTHVVEELPSIYNNIDVSTKLAPFKEKLSNLWSKEVNCDFRFRQSIDQRNAKQFGVGLMLEQMWNAAYVLFSDEFEHIANAQVDWLAQTENFWVRGGYSELYPETEARRKKGHVWGERRTDQERELKYPKQSLYPLDKHEELLETFSYHIGDCREKFGELAFCMREKPFLQLRHDKPLCEFVPRDDYLSSSKVEKLICLPKYVGATVDRDELQMLPGFQYGDLSQFSFLTATAVTQLHDSVAKWDAEPNEVNQCLLSTGINLCFNTLVGQAHYLGFTQYNDLTYPLTSQAIVTDGETWEFFAYQLNTIALVNFWEENETPCNIIWRSGPMNLYEKGSEGLNDKLLSYCLRFLLHRPEQRLYVDNYRPYLTQLETVRKNPIEMTEKFEAIYAMKHRNPKSRDYLALKRMPAPTWEFEEVAQREALKHKQDEEAFKSMQDL